jgi:hypothetical protein
MFRTPSKYPLVDGVPFAAALSPSILRGLRYLACGGVLLWLTIVAGAAFVQRSVRLLSDAVG